MVATNYAWNPIFDCITEETSDAGAVTAEYTHEPKLNGGLISQHRSGVTSVYHYDAIGTTRALTNSGQNITDTAFYTSFGEKVASTGTTVNPFGYAGCFGYHAGSTSGKLDVRLRNYHPSLARWLSADPMFFQENPYRYVSNQPTTYVDPSGALQAPVTTPPLRRLPGLPPPPPELPKLGIPYTPGGISIPGTADDQMNCLGASLGVKEAYGWPGLKVGCTMADWIKARGHVPVGCKKVDCKGITISETRCDANEIELILYFARWRNENGRMQCDFHVVGRSCKSVCFWNSKKDKRECIEGISDPWQSCLDAYKGVFTDPTVKVEKACLCCKTKDLKIIDGVPG